ncbi:hypothetical protein CPC08DRAFT_622454, partial [Agrocybe pediades]
MQSPSTEMPAVIRLVTASATPDIQKAAICKYFTIDAGYRHPLFLVEPAAESRDRVLAVYQWYRTISHDLKVDVQDVVYDRLHNKAYVDIVQTINLRFSPFTSRHYRIMCRFTLRTKAGLHYICKKEDFLHPDDVVAMICPPASPLVKMCLLAAAISFRVITNWFQLLGFWTAPQNVDHV